MKYNGEHGHTDVSAVFWFNLAFRCDSSARGQCHGNSQFQHGATPFTDERVANATSFQ